MRHHPDYVLEQTRLEERDGGTWVSGLCSYCWERLAFHAPPRGTTVQVCCPNGHPLSISDLTSEGRRPLADDWKPRDHPW
jgi:hypothetical protein